MLGIGQGILGQKGIADTLMMGMSVEGIIAAVVFSTVGLGYLNHSKKTGSLATMLCGIILLGYTYAVSNTLYIILIGTGVSSIPLLLNKLRKMGFRV